MDSLFAARQGNHRSNTRTAEWDKPRPPGITRLLVALALIAVVFGLVDFMARDRGEDRLVALSYGLERDGERP